MPKEYTLKNRILLPNGKYSITPQEKQEIRTMIGETFEKFVQQQFPDWRKVERKDSKNLPDFDAIDFLVEAKTGFYQYDVKLKGWQVAKFLDLRKERPVIYLLGFHTFANSEKELGGITRIRKLLRLRKDFNLKEIYVVNSDIAGKIWAGERTWQSSHLSKVDKTNHGRIKRRFLEDVIHNNLITRDGIEQHSREYYSLNLRKFVLQSPQVSQSSQVPYGFILHKEQDAPVVDYFRKRELLE